jgi:hypothetical protein
MTVSIYTAILHGHERESTTDHTDDKFCRACKAWFEFRAAKSNTNEREKLSSSQGSGTSAAPDNFNHA